MLIPEICQDIVLPELQARIFTTSCRYDIILERNALCHSQIILDFNNNIIKSSTSSIPVRSFPANFQGPQKLAQQLHLDEIDPFVPQMIPKAHLLFTIYPSQIRKFWPPTIDLSTFKQSFKTVLTFHKIN